MSESPFGGCDRITSFVIDEKNPVFDSRNDCNAIIETATNKLIQGFATTKIPEGVKTIAPAAFRSLQTLTEIELPASIENIEAEAFLYCNQMTKVVTHIKKPFAVSSMVFSGDNMKIAKLYVPFGTKEAYANTPGWDNFPYIIEMDPVEGEYAKNAASVVTTDFGKGYAALNGQVSVPITLVGEGIDPVNSIDYTITTDGITTEHHLELTEPVNFMRSLEVLVPLYADAITGEKDKVFTLTKVNGVANESTIGNMTAIGKLVTVVKKPKVIPVVEEATGTWCGWCARGIPGLALLNKVYRDDVITIAVHGGGSGDPMILDNYQLNLYSYPSCQINRGETVDPYYGSGSEAFGIAREVEAMQRSYVPAGVEVTAGWADDSQQAINVKTTTTFVDDVANANYRIGYVLVEDGMKGTTPEWYQSNYYAGSSLHDPNLINLTSGESKITNVAYNYIPVAAYEPFNGIENSLPSTIVKDEAMEHNYTIDISSNTRIQDKQKLSVVALLIDKNTGKIVNAAKFKFDKGSDSGNGGFNFFPMELTAKSCSRVYGDANPTFEYTVTGDTMEGTPEVVCGATQDSPVGTYPIVIKRGSVTNDNITFINGTLTITKAPLTVKVENATREQNMENPEFVVTYTGWKLNDDESVLTKKPTVTTDATKDSPVGTYEIVVSGGDANNYNLNYQNGVLTVMESTGIATVSVTCSADVYTLQGYKVRSMATTLEGLPDGIYMVNGKKVVVKSLRKIK